MNSAYLFAQGVGVVAFLVGITTFFNRDERRFRLQLALYSSIIGVHFFLMGASTAGMSAELNAIRSVVATRTRNLWVMVLFIVLTLVLGGAASCSIRWKCCRSSAPSPVLGHSSVAVV